MLRIRKIFFFLRIRILGFVFDFRYQDPDPIHFLAIVNKNSFFKRHITDKRKFSLRQMLLVSDDQSEQVYGRKSYNFQVVNIIF